MALVSVIIPNYNHAQFLKDRLESVLGQIYQNIEVIILDDASTDGSLQIIDEYTHHPKVTFTVKNEINSGSTFVQWNKGIQLAKGKYIWIAESDDYSEPGFLEKCVAALEKDESLSLAFCDTVAVDSTGEKLSYSKNGKPEGRYNAIDDKFFYYWFFLNDRFRILNASSCVFRKSCVDEKTMGECTQFKFAGDKYFWFDLLSKHPFFFYISDPLNYQRFHNNTTRAQHGIMPEYLRNLELTRIYDRYKKKGLFLDRQSYREIGKRMFAVNFHAIFLWKLPNVIHLIRGFCMVGLDIKYYKKILRTVLRGNGK